MDKFWGRGEVFNTRQAVTYLFNSCTLMGINPTKRFRWVYYIYYVVTYLNLCGFTQLVINFTYFMDKSDMTTSELLTSLQAAINIWGIPAKLVTITLALPRLRSAEEFMDTLDARCKRPNELARIRAGVMMGNRLVIYYLMIYYIYGSSTFLGAVATGRAPYTLYLPFWDWRQSTREFCQQIVVEFVIIFFLLYHQVIYDCSSAIYIYILRTHMQILVLRVQQLGTDINQEKNYDDLVNCVMDHQCILKLMNYVSPVISITVFVQFLIMAAILGVTMINIVIFADTSTQIGAVFYLFAVLMQTFPTCYFATLLIHDCEQLPLAVFHCNWADQNSKFRKMLIYFMQNTQVPIKFTALKLFPITLSTFLGIAKFSFSLYTLIKEMDFGQSLKTE